MDNNNRRNLTPKPAKEMRSQVVTLKAVGAVPDVYEAETEQIYAEIERCHILERQKIDLASPDVSVEEVVEAERRKASVVSTLAIDELRQFILEQSRSIKRSFKRSKLIDQNRQIRSHNSMVDSGCNPLAASYLMPKKIKFRQGQPKIGSLPPVALHVKSKDDLQRLAKNQISAIFEFYGLNINTNAMNVGTCRARLHTFLTTISAEDGEDSSSEEEVAQE